MSRLLDSLRPKGDTLQMILKRRGKPVSGIYVDDKKEIRSPSLKQEKKNEGPSRKA